MIDFSVATLSNGLRVACHHTPGAAMASVCVMYGVGSRNEQSDKTGLAHLLEHLMFGGSANVDDYDYHMDMAGGVNNAWTSCDFTCYYSTVPMCNLSTALWLESDRMLRPAFRQEVFDVQQRVVIEEFKQNYINQPYGMAGHLLREMLYDVHPYRWPTIGLNPEQIEHFKLSDAEEFFCRFYGPENAVVSIASALPDDQVVEMVEHWFGDIPRRNVVIPSIPSEPQHTAPRRLEERGYADTAMITLGYPMAAAGTEGYEAADIITDILSTGTSARFRRGMLKQYDIFADADASISGSEDPGFMIIDARLRDSALSTAREAEKILRGQLENVTAHGVSADELTRAVNKFETNLTLSWVNSPARTRAIAKSVLTGRNPNDIMARYRSLTPDDIRTAAQKIFLPEQSATLIYLPK